MLNALSLVFISLMILGQQTACAPTAPYIHYSTQDHPGGNPPADEQTQEEESPEEEDEENKDDSKEEDDKKEEDTASDVPEGVEFYSRETPESGPNPLTREL